MLRVDEDVLLDLGLLAVETRPCIDRWEIAPTPAREDDASDRRDYFDSLYRRRMTSLRDPWQESHGDEECF